MKNIIYSLIMVLLASGAFGQIDRSQPKPGPSPKVNLGKPQTFELKNGLKVMVVENHKLPQVTMTLSLDNPPFTEGDKKGIHDLTGSLIGNGTDKISKEDFQEEIDFMGARINFHSSGAFANSLSKYFSRTLELMAQGFINPKFTQEDFETDKARFIDGLKAEERSVQANAQRVENVLVFGANHPNGEFTTEEKLNALTLNDVKEHYKKYFIPNNAYLIVLGDVKFNEVKKLVEKEFKSWKKGKLPVSKYDEPKNVAKTEINFVDMPNAVQSEIAILSIVDLKMTDDDYYPALIANQIFGGDFNSYLNMNLREAHGWTYGAFSRLRGSKYVDKFKASSSVRNEVTDSAVFEAMKELKRIREEKVDANTLNAVKASLIGNFVMDAEKPEFIARQALLVQTQNLPDNFYENYIRNINAVTAEQVQKAAQKYFSYDNARILVVGKGSDVIPGLERLGYTINYFDRFGNPTEKPQQKTIDSDVTIASIMDNYIQAIGGEKIKSIETLTANYQTEMQGMKVNMKSISTTEGKSLTVISAMGMELQKTVFDGEKGYNSIQGMKNELSEDEIKTYKQISYPFPELFIDENSGFTLAGIENFNGEDAYVLESESSKTFYSINSGLKLGNTVEIEAGGQQMVQVITFENYEAFEGIKIPTKMVMDVGQQMVFDLIDVKFNETIDEAEFQ